MSNIALYGGEKTKKTPFGTGKRFGEAELQHVKEALEQNTLFYWFGTKVKELNRRFAEMYDMPYCVSTSSGTAAIHTALIAAGVTEGDEVITSPVTDMGSIIGILYQNAIPVFADVDPNTYAITAESIRAKLSDKTKAIVVVHLGGCPADMDPIMELAREKGIMVIEDCAQSYLTYYKGKLCGTIGDFGCFSLNDFKHISAGDGGMILMRDEELYRAAARSCDKNYNRLGRNTAEIRAIDSVAPNYRMSEVVGAVGLGQLDRLDFICSSRNRLGERLSEGIKDLPGLTPPKVVGKEDGSKSSYWFYLLRANPAELKVDLQEFVDALAAEGIYGVAKGYLHNPVYGYGLFQKKQAYLGTHAPFDSKYYGGNVDYSMGCCPVAEDVLENSIYVPLSEFYTDEDIDDIIAAFKKVSDYYQNR